VTSGAAVRDELVALREKYEEMRRLRVESDADASLGRPHHAPRERLKALSLRFPAALAEIDRIAFELLEERLAILNALLERDACSFDELPAWVRGWILVHRGLRGALAIKAWLCGVRTVDAELLARFDAALPTMRFSEDAAAFRDRLAEVASPPDGRLVDVIFDDASRALGTDRVALRALLMPRPHAR